MAKILFPNDHEGIEYIVNEDNYHIREYDVLPKALGFPQKKLHYTAYTIFMQQRLLKDTSVRKKKILTKIKLKSLLILITSTS